LDRENIKETLIQKMINIGNLTPEHLFYYYIDQYNLFNQTIKAASKLLLNHVEQY